MKTSRLVENSTKVRDMFGYTLDELYKVRDFYYENDKKYWETCDKEDESVVTFTHDEFTVCNPFMYFNTELTIDEILDEYGAEMTKEMFDTALERYK